MTPSLTLSSIIYALVLVFQSTSVAHLCPLSLRWCPISVKCAHLHRDTPSLSSQRHSPGTPGRSLRGQPRSHVFLPQPIKSFWFYSNAFRISCLFSMSSVTSGLPLVLPKWLHGLLTGPSVSNLTLLNSPLCTADRDTTTGNHYHSSMGTCLWIPVTHL